MLTHPPYKGRERIIHIHENVHCTILFWVGEIYQISNSTKTSVNKRYSICLKIHPKRRDISLQRRFSGAKVQQKNGICK